MTGGLHQHQLHAILPNWLKLQLHNFCLLLSRS